MGVRMQISETGTHILFFLCFAGIKEQRLDTSLACHKKRFQKRNYGLSTDRTLAFQSIKYPRYALFGKTRERRPSSIYPNFYKIQYIVVPSLRQ